MTDITIPDSVTSIGNSAFSGCSSLTDITIPESVTNIEDSAFEYCSSLTGITIPESVTSIERYAFRNCTGLKSITIPKSVESVGDEAFSGCTALTEVLLEGGSTLTSESFGEVADKVVTRWNEDSLIWTLAADGTMTISGTGTMKNYSNDSPATQKKDNIKKVVIEDGVTSIGDNAFYDCTGLTSIEIPSSVTSIGDCAFYNCTGLTSITIPDRVTSIGDSAFRNCTGLTSVTIPDSVTSIGDCAFSGTLWLTNKQHEDSLVIVNGILIDGTTCSGEVTIPYGVTSIGNFAFYNCTGLTSISIPKSVTSIGTYTFSGCGNLTEITVPCDSTLTKDAFEDASEKVKYRHSLVKTDAKDATYTEAGNVEYWTCENCKKHFLSDETDVETAKAVEQSATVKPVLVQVATATTQIKCVYGQDMDEINLQDYVKNADAVGEVSVKVATGSTMLDGMQLDGSKLSGKPAKVYTDGKDVTFTFTAKNGNTANLTLHFLVAKADPTVEVTVDGDTHTEGDLVEKLGLSISKDSTKGAAKIVSELKALAAGKNTLAWEFTPEDSENYNVVTGTVVVNAQTTTTTNETTSTTKETTATTKATTATNGTTATSGTTSASETTMTTSASNTESTAATSATTITTAATTSVTNIADEDLCSWAINDYQKKAGIVPANAEITARSEETCEITLTDENGNVLDVYTVDPKTGVGTDSSNAEVNLPQTGNNAMTNWLLCVGAALFMAFGFGAVKASGVLKRKEDE